MFQERAHLQLANIIKKINDVGKCPVCLTLVTPPSGICTNGHIMCKNCVSQESQCPLCSTSLISNYTIKFKSFNIVSLDNLLNELPRTCENDVNGCTFIDTTEKMINDHKLSCGKRIVNCRIQGCKWKNEFDHLKSHLEDIHKDLILVNCSTVSMKYTDDLYIIYPVLLGDLLIWKHIYFKTSDNTMFTTLEFFAANEKQKKYTCVYTIKGMNNNFQYTCTNNVWKEDANIFNIISSSGSMKIPLDMLNHIKDDQNFVKYIFEIKEFMKNNDGST